MPPYIFIPLKMTLENLDKIVSSSFDVDIKSKSRDIDSVMARAVFYDLAYNKFKVASLSRIGKYVERHHATVLHSLNNVLPIIPKCYKYHDSVYKDILRRIFVYDDKDLNETDYTKLERLRIQYNDLLEKYNDLCNEEADRSQLISSIRRLSEDKVPILKLRVDAILKMI